MTSSEATTLDSSEREQLTFVITQVFTLVKRMYPRTWGQGWASEAEVRESQRFMWKLLSKSGRVPNTKGLERLQDLMIERGGDWPPSIPDIVKCLRPVPEDFGFLETETAWSRVKQNASCLDRVPDAARIAASEFSWELKHCRADEADKRFKRRFAAAYEGAVNRAMRGEDLNPVAQLEHTKAAPEPHPAVKAIMERQSNCPIEEARSEDRARSAIAEMRAAIGEKA